MGPDEVGTARTLRENRAVTGALVAKHGGRIVKTTGDGVLLEFPSHSRVRDDMPDEEWHRIREGEAEASFGN